MGGQPIGVREPFVLFCWQTGWGGLTRARRRVPERQPPAHGAVEEGDAKPARACSRHALATAEHVLRSLPPFASALKMPLGAPQNLTGFGGRTALFQYFDPQKRANFAGRRARVPRAAKNGVKNGGRRRAFRERRKTVSSPRPSATWSCRPLQ